MSRPQESTTRAATEPESGRGQSLAVSGREVAMAISGAAAMSVAQPLFDLLSKNAGFLTAHELVGARLIAFALALGVGLPAALAAAYRIVDRVSRTGPQWPARSVAAVFLSLCGAVFSLLLLGRLLPALMTSPWLAIPSALAAGGLGALLILRYARLRQFMGLLAFGVLLFPALFLLSRDVSPLLQRAEPESPELVTELDQRPVVLVVFDELPTSTLMTQDQLVDDRRFPAFGALAATSTWFRRAVSASPQTAVSIPAIVTGRLPVTQAEPVVINYPRNLFRWMASSGYELFVEQSHTRLCPEELCREIVPSASAGEWFQGLLLDLSVLFAHLVSPEPWASRLPAVDQTWEGFWQGRQSGRPGQLGSSVPGIVDSYLAAIESEPRNRLYYLHLNLPHVPWKYLPTGTEYGPLGQSVRPPGAAGELWIDDGWLTLQGYQQHLLQTMYADRVLGQLTERLEEVGIWDEALVIVTADHGASFWPGHSRRMVEESTIEDILEVPLFVKLPGQQTGKVDDKPVQNTDIVDTLGDVLGAAVPWSTSGVSLLADAEDSGSRQRHHVFPSRGEKHLIEVSAERRQRTLARKHRHFGSGASSLFGIGAHPELLGRRLQELQIGSSARSYRLLDPWAFEAVDPESGFVPARVFAEVDQDPGPPQPLESKSGWLAVALNGTVRAITRPYRGQDRRFWFSAMIEESAFDVRENVVEVFEIMPAGDGSNVELLRMNAESAPRVTLQRSGSTVTAIQLTSSDDAGDLLAVPVVPGAVRDAMFFGAGDRELPDPPWDIAFTIDRNFFRGRTSLQISVKEIRAAR